MLRWVRALLRNLFGHRRLDEDLTAELESYAELVADEHRRRGADSQTARRLGQIALGGSASVSEAVRAVRVGHALRTNVSDLRGAVRRLTRSPGYSAIAIVTLTLGIGANTVLFSVIDAAIFKPLPYDDPDRLVEIATTYGR